MMEGKEILNGLYTKKGWKTKADGTQDSFLRKEHQRYCLRHFQGRYKETCYTGKDT